MTPDAAQSRKLITLLDELSAAIESILRTGLTTASPSTLNKLAVTFTETSRMRLLRLGSTLRVVNEEIKRFTEDSPLFSASRLSLFLNRAWMLSRATGRALRDGDAAQFAELNATGGAYPINRIEVVALGVAKRVVSGVVNIFDFRLRVVAAEDDAHIGQALQWACLYPVRRGVDIAPEAYLQLPYKLKQPDKFRPAELLTPCTFTIRSAMIRETGEGQTPAMVLSEDSTVDPADAFSDWPSLTRWDPAPAMERLRRHRPGPLELDIDLTEEVVLAPNTWTIDAKPDRRIDQHELYIVTLAGNSVTMHVRVPITGEGDPLRDAIARLATTERRPALFGLLHYESCRLILQPLSCITDDGPQHLQLAAAKVSKAELIKALKFDL